jgi:hypothetical protein
LQMNVKYTNYGINFQIRNKSECLENFRCSTLASSICFISRGYIKSLIRI